LPRYTAKLIYCTLIVFHMLYTRLLFSLCVVTCLTSVSHLQRVKVGRCPELPARYLTNQLQHDRCRDDYDCDSTMKCCESIIGKVCMMPKDYDQKEVCKQPYTKWDSCGGGCMTTCYNIGWQQPCRQSCQPGCTCISGFVRLYLHPYAPCVPQIHCPNQRTTRKKFGVCPTLPQGAEIDYHRRRDRCGTDFDCSGTCPDGQKTSIFCDERDSCPWGYTCRSGLCCPNAPWQSPTATWPGQVTTAAGNCPHYAYIGTWAQLAPSCFTNSNCAYNQLCCYTYYGNRCIQVSQSEAHHQKTIDPNHQKIPCGGAVRWKLTNLPVSTVKNKPTLSFYIGKQNYMTNRLYDNVFKEPHYPDSWHEDEETLYKNAGEKQMNYVSKTASMLHVRLYLTGLRRICKVEIRFGTTPVEKHLFFQLFHLTQPKIDNIQSKSVTLSWKPSMSALLYTGGRLVYVIALSTVRPFATLCDLETDLKLDRVNLLEHRRQEHVAHRLIPQHHSGAVRSLTVLDATGPAKLQLISLQQNTNYYANVFALDLNTGENIAYNTVSFTTTSENQISQHRLVSSLTEAQLQTGYLGPSRVAFKVYQFSAPVAISELYILIQPCTGPLQAAIYQDGQKTLHYSIEELQAINLTGVNVGIVQIQIANDDNQAKIFNIWASNNYSAYPYPKLPYDTSITVTERKCDSVQLSWLASTDAHVYCLYKRVQRFDYFKQLTLEDWNLCQQPDENLQPLFCNQFRGNQYRNEILIQEIAALKPATTYRFDLFVSKHNQPSLAYRTVWIRFKILLFPSFVQIAPAFHILILRKSRSFSVVLNEDLVADGADRLNSDFLRTISLWVNKYLRRSRTQEMDSPPNPLVLSGLRSLLYTFPDGVTFTVPIFLHKAFSVLEAHYLTTEGIFRKPGIASKLRVLKNCFNASSALELNFKIEEVSPFDLCDLIKLFLREIDEPILTWGLQPQFLQFADLNTPRDVRTKCLLQLCHALPPRHKETLAFIMRFLKMISNSSAYNKMDVKNLATVFVPCIFRESAKARPVKHGQALLDELAASKSDIALKVDVLEMLIQNADSIGVLSEQERAILAAESSDKLNDDLNILKRSAKKAASKVLVRSRNSLSGNRNSQIYRRSVQPKLKSAESIERHERIKGSRITEPYKRRSVCSLEKSQGLSDKGENAIIRQNRCLQEKHVKPMRSSMFETIYSSAFTEGISTSSVIEEQCTTSPILRTSSLPDRKVISTENRECLKVNKAEGELVRAEPVQTVLRGTTVQFMSSDNELQDAYSKQSCLYEELSSALDNFAKTINVGLKSPIERMEVCCTEVELLHAEEEEDKTKKNDAKGKEARLPRCISAPVESVPQAGGTFAKKRNTSLGASKLRRGMPNSLKSGLREPKTPFSSPLKNQQQANIKASSNNMDKNNSVVVAVEQPERNLEIESKENIIQTTKVSSTNMDIVEDDEFKDSDMKKQIILQQINPDDDDNHPASEVGFCIRPSVNFIREHRKGHVRSKIQEFTDRESRLEFVGEETDSSSVIGQSPAEISKRTTTSKPTATRKPSSSSGNKGCSLNIKFSACF
ncbi:Protein NDNF, partial [Trichinella pseudospiralis]